MIRSLTAIFAVLAVLVSAADGQTFKRAEDRGKYAGFGLSLPIAAFNHKPDTRSTNVGLAVSGFLSLSRRFWIEGELSAWEHEEVLEDINFKIRSYLAGINVDLFEIETIRLTPYLGTGLFLLQAGSSGSASELIYYYYGYFDWEYTFGAYFGGGLRWQIIDKFGLRLDVRDQVGSKVWGHESGRHFIRTALSVVFRSPQ